MQALKGRLVSGMGLGTKIMADYMEVFKGRLGVPIFPGTLNLQLEFDWEMPKDAGYIERFVKSDGTKRGSVLFLKAKVKNFPVFIIRPELTKHPKSIIELISPINIRKQYGLKDGDIVEVRIDHE